MARSFTAPSPPWSARKGSKPRHPPSPPQPAEDDAGAPPPSKKLGPRPFIWSHRRKEMPTPIGSDHRSSRVSSSTSSQIPDLGQRSEILSGQMPKNTARAL
jgi:hypothetical protein